MKIVLALVAILAVLAVTANASKRHHHRQQGGSSSSASSLHNNNNNEATGKCPRRKFCGRGKECRLNEVGEPQCFCIDKCPEPKYESSICGSDGQFYPSHCHLNRHNCITGDKITADVLGNSCPQDDAPSHDLRDEGTQQQEQPLCSADELEILKDNLLLYHHEHVRSLGKNPSGKEYLLNLMFSHFDRNKDAGLDYAELQEVMADDKIANLAPPGCSLTYLFQYDDTDSNDIIDMNEFYVAFNKLYTVSLITLDKAVQVIHITAQVGDNVELKCDVHGVPPMRFIWKRYQVDLSSQDDHGIRVFSDGTLYLDNIQLLHSGNYTCHGERNTEVVQTHVLTVQAPPDVHVSPHIVMTRPGTNVTLNCRVTGGEPVPSVQWLKNDDPIMSHASSPANPKYIAEKNNVALTILDVYFSDTGAYMCEGKNSAGRRIDLTSVVVVAGAHVSGINDGGDESEPSLREDNRADENGFLVFHEKGISFYDPNNCRLLHQIQATDIIPGSQDAVCSSSTPAADSATTDDGANSKCRWGRAIKVSNSYVYASQPNLDRILVVSISQRIIVDVVSTDRFPVELAYVEHLDQVWVQSWRSPDSWTEKTLLVIRDAKEKKKHHTVHPEPIKSHFDVVANLFLPPNTKSSSQFRFGYVTHKNNRGFYKLDLVALRYVKSIDLTIWNCVPGNVQFAGLYGMIIIECHEPVTGRQTGEIVFDALTDSVVHFKGDRLGTPYLSPDSRNLVTVSHEPIGGTTLLVQHLAETGLHFSFDVKTSLNISKVAFYPSRTSHTYDLFATAVDKQDVLFVDLITGKVEMVTGFPQSNAPQDEDQEAESADAEEDSSASPAEASSSISTPPVFPWSEPHQRPISSQSLFSKYLVTRTQESVFIINGNSHTANCQIGGLTNPDLILWM